MAIGKKAARKVKKAVKAVARVSPVELDPRKKGFLTPKNPSLQKTSKSMARAALRIRVSPVGAALRIGVKGTGKGRGARIIPPGAFGVMKALPSFKPMKTLASKGTRGLPEKQEARRRKVAQKSKTRTRKSY